MRDLSVTPSVRTWLKADGNFAGQLSRLIVELLQLVFIQAGLPQPLQLFAVHQPGGRLSERLSQSLSYLFRPKVRMAAVEGLRQFLRAPFPFLKPLIESLPERLFRVA